MTARSFASATFGVGREGMILGSLPLELKALQSALAPFAKLTLSLPSCGCVVLPRILENRIFGIP